MEAYQRNFEPTERQSDLSELAPILDDRAALRAFVRNAVAKERWGFFGIADALGQSELALVSVRAIVGDPGYPDFREYWQLWLIPHAGVRTMPGFKALQREAGKAPDAPFDPIRCGGKLRVIASIEESESV